MADITPRLADLLQMAIDSKLSDLHTAIPAIIDKYDEATQTADVKPQIQRILNKVDGTTTTESLPTIPNVPIAFPRGGGYFLSFPLKKGDNVFLVFSERSLDKWREKGEDVDPEDARNHSLDGAVAIPCLYPNADKLADAHASNMVIGQDGGAQIHLKDSGQVHLSEENASQFVALGSSTDSRISSLETAVNAFITIFNAHTHTGVTTGGGVSGTSSTPGIPAVPGSSVAATKVKAT